MNVVETIRQKVIHLPPKAQEEVLEIIEQIEERYQAEDKKEEVHALTLLAALFGVCYLIIQRTSSLSGNPAPAKNDFQDNFQPEQLNSVNTAQLESAPREPAMSVTDTTTRTLDKELIR